MEGVPDLGFLEYGLAGSVILALLAALRHVFKLYVDVQEKRITESRETVAVIKDFTGSIDTLTDVVKNQRRE